MSKTKIPDKIINLLWAKSGGRCEYDGCNKILYTDLLTKRNVNSAYMAHIVADSENGPRGSEKSEELSKDINNLMLLCDTHHRLIDKDDVKNHSVERLILMKKQHEERIERLTNIANDKCSTIVLFGANIGDLSPILSYKIASKVIVPNYYPAENNAIEIGFKNSSFNEKNNLYWQVEEKNLVTQCQNKIIDRIKAGEISHISLFAIAPQPLLVKLGTLLPDIYSVDVYQKHREPDTWEWQPQPEADNFIINRPLNKAGLPCLVFALSATITQRIQSQFSKASIWEMTINTPNNDFLKSKEQLSLFRERVRLLFDEIKRETQKLELHIFMAMPIACAVELGRAWMPKADMAMLLYDYNSSSCKDEKTITIKNI